MMRRIVGGVLIAISLTATPALAALSAVSPALVRDATVRPRKIVLLPPQIFVYELSAGGVPTRKADWEATARENLAAAATRQAREAGLFELLPAPALPPSERDTLEAHIGLYERVAQSVFVYGRGEQAAWAHKKNEFDYTVGPGLAFLRDRSGADAALIVLGSDYISSGGRKAAFAAGLLLGIVMPLGQSFITSGIVDLRTGDVQWMSFDASARMDSRNPADVDDLMRALFQTYPHAR
ncbi:hypothetical protein [Thiobacillus sedimenti]|uniref:Uncharacterized protein n=1 Tax=Thiobacillus sedimenti TaxID=3110231 RepID=A0ABZ1CIP0_9PROT|nr:hypothetical protein [Thiobacillus sp. SCUT-2]WRS39269.1 hypothetical protein VA613_14875 [Thiobacillus sp. SCUT-2]